MKKIYLFLALAIAVAINANAVNDNLQLHTWDNGDGVLDKLSNKVFTKVGDLWTIEFETPITLTKSEKFLVKDDKEVYLKTWDGQSARTVWAYSKDQNDNDRKAEFELAAGTYYSVTIVKTDYADYVISFNSELGENEKYTFFIWSGDMASLNGKEFKRINGRESEYIFEPLELANDQEFLLKRDGKYVRSPKHKQNAYTSWTGIIHNDDHMDNSDFKLKAGKYYSATIKDGVLKFNTYAETETGLDAVVNSAADYVKVKATLYGHYFDGTYLFASTTENNSSKKNTINEGDKGLGYSDDESEFTQNDWVAIEGLTSDFVGKEIAAGNIVELKANAAYPVVKFVASVTPADGKTLTANTYRVANFNIGKDVNAVKYVWLVAPQAGEYCHVRGYVAAAADGKVTLKSAKESSTATIGETQITVDPVEMTVNYSGAVTTGKWFSFTGIVVKNGDALELNALSAEDVSTGVESVETANAAVFAANGTINVSSEAQAAIEVYTANGQMVSAINADNASIAVAPGFYLVKVGNQVSKVVVK